MKYSPNQINEALVLSPRSSAPQLTKLPSKKSLFWGSALGLLGPVGWLYAGSFKETVPAALITLALISISVFKPILFFLLPILLPVSALIGGIYAWSYNRTGTRHSFVLGSEKK